MDQATPIPTKQRVIFYIDGLNLYRSLIEKTWQELNWLDVVKFCESHLPEDSELVAVKYYTSALSKHKAKKAQSSFLECNKKINGKKFIHIPGFHLPDTHKCEECSHESEKLVEKKTDVNIAVDMIDDAILEKSTDISILVTNDTDLVPSIKKIKKYNSNHRIMIFVPPTKSPSSELQQAVSSATQKNVIILLKNEQSYYIAAQLPEEVKINDDYTAKRPEFYNKEMIADAAKRKWEKKRAENEAAGGIPDEKLNQLMGKYSGKR